MTKSRYAAFAEQANPLRSSRYRDLLAGRKERDYQAWLEAKACEDGLEVAEWIAVNDHTHAALLQMFVDERAKKEAAARKEREEQQAALQEKIQARRREREEAEQLEISFLEEFARKSTIEVDAPDEPKSLREVFDLLLEVGTITHTRDTVLAQRLRAMLHYDVENLPAWETSQRDRFMSLSPDPGGAIFHETERDCAKWFVLRDRETKVPPYLADPEAFARDYRSQLGLGADVEMIVVVAPASVGVDCILWGDAPALAGFFSGSDRYTIDDGPYYLADSASAADVVHLPAAAPRLTLALLRKSGDRPPAVPVVVSSGIPTLDARLPFGGLAAGRIVTLAGPKGCGKTSICHELEESALAAGYLVLHFAVDEAPDEIEARRIQRHGSPEAVAASDVRAGGELYFVDSDEHVDAVWLEAARVDTRPLMVVLDSLQTVQSSSSEGRGLVERIEALFADLKRCQKKRQAIVLATSEVTRVGGEAKGGTKPGHSSHVLVGLSLVRDSDEEATVRLTFQKNRAGRMQPFTLTIDKSGQRVLDPDGPKPSSQRTQATRDRIRGAILALVEGRGSATSRQIEAGVTGSTPAIRAALKGLVQDGALVLVDGRYTAPNAADRKR